MPTLARTTMDNVDLKELLLATSGEIIACGKIWNICSNHLGAGVYKVFLKEWTVDYYKK